LSYTLTDPNGASKIEDLVLEAIIGDGYIPCSINNFKLTKTTDTVAHIVNSSPVDF
jgi:hypothetical protein